jgi:hypothetical protein
MAKKSHDQCQALEPQIDPGAWERFERAVDTVSKSGPIHRSATKKDAGDQWLIDFRRRVEERISAEKESPFLVAQNLAQIRRQCSWSDDSL